MTDTRCHTHPDWPALFRCEACGRALCSECVREGHRLIFCGLCGERALAIGGGGSSTVPERKRGDKVERRYSFREALAYPFRGSGRLMLPAFVLLMVASTVVPLVGPAAAFLARILLPGLLFEIVRTTAEGQVELPDWPDYSDLAARIREIVWLLLVGLTVLLPSVVLLYFSGQDVVSLFLGGDGNGAAPAWGLRLAGIALGALLGVFAFGATGAHSSGWLWFRIDLHVQALTTPAGRDATLVAALLTPLLFLSALARPALDSIPVLGTALDAALSGYAMFAGAHLVGLIFRRHARLLDPIYRG